MNKTLKTLLKICLSLCLGGFFIWIFVRKLTPEDFIKIGEGFKSANYWWVAVGLVIGIGSHWARAQRWKLLVESLGYQPRSVNMFGAVMVAYLTNLALPRVGEIARCTILTRHEKIPFSQSFGTVITERMFDFICFVVFFFIHLIIQFSTIRDYVFDNLYAPLVEKMSISKDSEVPHLLFWGGIILLIVVLVFLYKRFKHTKLGQKINQTLRGFSNGFRTVLRLKNPLPFLFYTILMWSCYLFMAYVVFFSLPATAHLPLSSGFAALLFGTIGLLLVQGGIGIYPAIISETLGIWGVNLIDGYTMGWLVWSMQQAVIILLGLAALLFLTSFNKHSHGKPLPNPAENLVA